VIASSIEISALEIEQSAHSRPAVNCAVGGIRDRPPHWSRKRAGYVGYGHGKGSSTPMERCDPSEGCARWWSDARSTRVPACGRRHGSTASGLLTHVM